jgi:general secretion pathway protein K
VSARADARRRRGLSEGSALILALLVLLLLSLLVTSFTFDMRVAAGIASRHRRRARAQALALAGVEWARCALAWSAAVDPEGDPGEDPDLHLAAVHLARGVPVSDLVRPLGDGAFRLHIVPEQGRRDVNRLTTDEWYALLRLGGVPPEQWDELVDGFMDWIDEDDLRRLHGAESDDPFYVERGVEARNAPIPVLSEMALIKGFDPAILYGGPARDPMDPPWPGIAAWLTTWGDGRVHLNAASREVLLTIPGLADWQADALIEARRGVDGLEGTETDGFDSVPQALASAGLEEEYGAFFVTGRPEYVRVAVAGEVQGLRTAIWCVLHVSGPNITVVSWREEPR